MTEIFYDHIVLIEEITSKLDDYNLDSDAKEELINLIDETMHHEILNFLLSNLPEEHHKDFLTMLYRDPQNEEILEYLKTHSGKDIQKMIKLEAEKIKKQLLEEIKKSK